MKKILFLLLFTIASYGQAVFDEGIQITNTESTTAEKVNVQENDGTLNWQFIKDFQNNKPYFSTGLLKNGLLTINADNTKFDLSAGIGVYSDFTDPENVTSKVFNFPAFSAVVSPYIATSNITYVAVNYNGGSPVLVMQAAPFSNTQMRDLVVVGAVIHSNFTTINVINNISSPSNDVGNSVADLFNFLGARNQEGNVYSANGANLQLNKSAGVILKYGANFHVNAKNPHNVSLPEQLSLTFRYRLQGGFEGTDRINVDVDNYDLNNVLTAVPNNKYTIQPIFIPQTGQTRIQYGQTTYNTLADAIAAINTRKFNVETNLATQFVKVAYLVVKKGTTSLQVVTDSDIIQASKFDATASGGVAITYQSIIDALGYVPANDLDALHKTGNETKTGKLNLSNTNLYSVENPVFSGLADTGIAGNLNGTYTYSINYYSALGETETSGEQTISVVNKQVAVTLPISPNPTVIGRRIYRTVANPFDTVIKKLVADIPNNTATSYTDNILDGSLGADVPRVNTTGGQFFNNSNRVGFASNGTTSFGYLSALLNTGYANSSFGFSSMTDNTTGYRNTASGVFSLYKNTTGYNNSAFGVHASNNNTSGSDNNTFGFSAGFLTTTGTNNSSFGSFANSSNLVGSYISAFGNSALQLNTSSNNSAFGYFSGGRNTTGTGGTFIGTQAGEFNSTGNFNTSTGDGSMKANTIGSFNSVYGFQSAFNGSSFGTSNSFFGSQSGYNSIGSGNVFLGKSAGYYETGDNKLFIDNANRLNEADGRLKALIYGQFDASTPNQFITINGTLNTLKSKIISPLIGSSFFSSLELIRDNVVGGAKIESLRDVAIGGVGFNISVTANNSDETTGNYTDAVQILNTGVVKILSLAGTGNRAVIADPSGNLSTPTNLVQSGTITASPATVDTELATLGQAKAVARPYKVYTALLTQSGTNAPVAIVLENTTGLTITYSRTSEGFYVVTFSSIVDTNKQFFTLSNEYSGTIITTQHQTSTSMRILVQDSITGSYKDASLNRNSFEIRVYN